ncbi:MAG: DJ-1/PfpI family protein [Candidatus Omnitrophica bacterium]|nr:DJ-1/PfpI family protein [Candidatus Omnitrophota bacterium]MBU4488837.1 DJ-1/PfpI family protein [Candidatus Omnitrophota bacterium]MCG2705200.1 DJ-1/PfpI family protein [Candidatus Omnitrophota bacterium]
MKKKIAVLLADGFEEIEAVTCIDILRRADQEIKVVGVGGMIIKGSHGIGISADVEINSYNDLPDAIVLPGGMPGVQNLFKTPKVVSLVREVHKKGNIVAAICAAPAYVLAPMGILDGKKATCYFGCEEMLGKKAIYVDQNVVLDGNIITSKGPATAMAFALRIIDLLCGRKVTDSIREKLLYEE